MIVDTVKLREVIEVNKKFACKTDKSERAIEIMEKSLDLVESIAGAMGLEEVREDVPVPFLTSREYEIARRFQESKS